MLLVGTIFVTGADELIKNNFSKSSIMDKASRDILLDTLPSITEKGKEIKEIKPTISISCYDKYCLWSATQEGLINSLDNRINREYCSKNNKTDCTEHRTYTYEEIENKVTELVNEKLLNYANAKINRENKLLLTKSEGTLTVNEK
jgi:hypothetical protein